MKIYIDADACPVKKEVIEEAKRADVSVTLVKSYAHFAAEQDSDGVESVYVDNGADSADFRIMQLIRNGDILVTQDYGLASLALEKGAIVLHHSGYQYTKENIDELLTMRHANAKARKSGQKTKGPRALTGEDREKFRQLMRNKLFFS